MVVTSESTSPKAVPNAGVKEVAGWPGEPFNDIR